MENKTPDSDVQRPVVKIERVHDSGSDDDR